MNFFIATVGRSGSTWLANLLNKSQVYTVSHEEVESRPAGYILPYTPFPVERFARPCYGEVHGFLRYSLTGGVHGAEVMIPRRGLLKRCPFAVIRSWMQKQRREEWEFSAVAFEVLTQQRLLDVWAESDVAVRRICFEEITTDLTALRELFAWLQVEYEPTQEDMEQKVNASDPGFEWTDELIERVNVLAKKQGILKPLKPYEYE